MASSSVSPATKRRAMRRVMPLEVTHLAKRGLSESLRSVARSIEYDYARVNPLRLVRVLFQELFRVQGGHTAGACGGDSLAVTMVLHISGDEYAGNGGQAAVFGDEVAIAVHLQLALENGGVGIVPDGHEYSFEGNFRTFFSFRIAHAHAGNVTVRSVNFLNNRRDDKFDLRVGSNAINHDFRGTKFFAPVDEVDLAGVARQKIGLFHRGIAPADNRDSLRAKEVAVTGRAGRKA